MTAGGEEGVEEIGSPDPGRDEGSVSAKSSTKLPKLSFGMRVVAFVIGWGLVLVGVVGLALPGIQGVLTLLAGTAVLSVVSETVYRLLRRLFRRWPSAWKRVRGFRRRVHGWLHRGESAADPEAEQDGSSSGDSTET